MGGCRPCWLVRVFSAALTLIVEGGGGRLSLLMCLMKCCFVFHCANMFSCDHSLLIGNKIQVIENLGATLVRSSSLHVC